MYVYISNFLKGHSILSYGDLPFKGYQIRGSYMYIECCQFAFVSNAKIDTKFYVQSIITAMNEVI